MSTNKRQPRFITSKFDGRCADCGRETRAGERVFWRARGEVECGDCAAFNGRDIDSVPAAQPAAPQQSAPQPQSGDFHAALSWDDTPPARGASIAQRNSAPTDSAPLKLGGNMRTVRMDQRESCDDCGKLAELSHHDATGLALCHDCEAKHDERIAEREQVPTAAPVVELAAKRIADTVSEPAPELDATCATVCDLLVTLVNAVDRLDSEQCDALRATALHYANDSASGTRRRTWQAFARFIA